MDGEGGEGVIFVMELKHAAEIDGADDVDVVEEEWLVEALGVFKEKPGGFFQAAASVEKDVFTGEFDANAKIVFGFEVVGDHVGEMMDVDDEFGDAEGAQAGKRDFE